MQTTSRIDVPTLNAIHVTGRKDQKEIAFRRGFRCDKSVKMVCTIESKLRFISITRANTSPFTAVHA